MEQIEKDKKYMMRALQLAKLGGVKVAPNPKVGAVIVYKDKIIGEGYHHEYGAEHAEVNAINSVKEVSLLSSATIYVTLEPCVHFGKTPPCADLLIKHQLKRVVIACLDSNAKVLGKGVKKLKESGITVEVGILEKEAKELNKRFFTFQNLKRPYVILKWAETKDGFIDKLATQRDDGVNWISNSKTKLLVHKWRSEEQAIMVGWKTINSDNPKLNVRLIDAPSPYRFIIDPHGNCNLNNEVFNDNKPTTLLTLNKNRDKYPKKIKIAALQKMDASPILNLLYQENIISVFIEGGANTLQSFIDAELWDEAYQIIGNKEFKQGIMAPTLSQAHKVLKKTESIADDLLLHFSKKY